MAKQPKHGGKIESYKWFWEGLAEYLTRKQLKQTKQRNFIVERFLSLSTHVSAEDLHAACRDSGENIGLATIYRTLNLLVDANLVEQKSFGEGKQVFEVHTPDGHHDHLICLDCGTVVEFENAEIEMLQERVARNHQFRLASHRLDLFGHCLNDQCEHRK